MKVRKEVWEKAAIVAATVVVCLVGVVWAQVHPNNGGVSLTTLRENNNGGTRGKITVGYLNDLDDPHASMIVATSNLSLLPSGNLRNNFALENVGFTATHGTAYTPLVGDAFADVNIDPMTTASAPVGNAGYVLVETNLERWDLIVTTRNGGLLTLDDADPNDPDLEDPVGWTRPNIPGWERENFTSAADAANQFGTFYVTNPTAATAICNGGGAGFTPPNPGFPPIIAATPARCTEAALNATMVPDENATATQVVYLKDGGGNVELAVGIGTLSFANAAPLAFVGPTAAKPTDQALTVLGAISTPSNIMTKNASAIATRESYAYLGQGAALNDEISLAELLGAAVTTGNTWDDQGSGPTDGQIVGVGAHGVSATGQTFIVGDIVGPGGGSGGATDPFTGTWQNFDATDAENNVFQTIGERGRTGATGRGQYLGSFSGWTHGPIKSTDNAAAIAARTMGYYDAMAFYVNAGLTSNKVQMGKRNKNGTYSEDIIFTFWGTW